MRFSSGVMSYRRPQALVLLVILVSVFAALSVAAIGGTADARGTMQLYVFPVLLVLFSKIAFGGVRLPRILLGLSCICALSGAVMRYSDIGVAPGAFVVARLEGDAMLNKTHILEDKLRSFVGKGSLSLIGSFGRSVSNATVASEVLQQQPEIGGVVWGDEKAVVVSIRPSPPLKLSSFPRPSVAHILLHRAKPPELYLLTSVPQFSVAKTLDIGTMEFVGKMLPLVKEFPEVLANHTEQPSFERDLRGVAGIKSTWKSLSHRAMPMFMTGTYHLVLAISGPKISWGDLLCAEQSLSAAERQLGYYDNPALHAAIMNNLAIAKLARSFFVADSKPARKGMYDLLAAVRRLSNHRVSSSISETFWTPLRANMASLGISDKREEKKRNAHDH